MMSSVEHNTNLQRHKSLYFDDGDIIITAPIASRLERKTMLFRVDKVFLARHSPVFKDMLSLPPVLDQRDMYDGVPRVDLTDDAKDFESLLAAMYNIASLPLERFNPDKPRLLMGAMRLAIKYGVNGIRHIIERSVKEDWPHDIRSYEAWNTERRHIESIRPNDWWCHFPEPAAAMQFATEFECSEILPSIVYYMTTFSIVHKIKFKGATSKSHVVRWYLLDSLNFFRLLRAKAAIETDVNFESYFESWDDPLCCLDEINDLFQVRIAPNLIGYDELRFSEDCRKYTVCETCISEMEDSPLDWSGAKLSLWTCLRKCVTESPTPWPGDIEEEEPIAH